MRESRSRSGFKSRSGPMGRIGLRSPPPVGGRSVVSVCDNLANFGGRTSQLRPSTIAVFVSLIVQVCRGEIFLVQSWGQLNFWSEVPLFLDTLEFPCNTLYWYVDEASCQLDPLKPFRKNPDLYQTRTYTRSTQPCIPPGSLNRVPASAGVRAGMSPLPGGR